MDISLTKDWEDFKHQQILSFADFRATVSADSFQQDSATEREIGGAMGRYGYIKNHKKTVKNEQARIRESEEYKAEARKALP
ncbi:hypothetical protein Tco_0093158 [Tanacetum coccineum]